MFIKCTDCCIILIHFLLWTNSCVRTKHFLCFNKCVHTFVEIVIIIINSYFEISYIYALYKSLMLETWIVWNLNCKVDVNLISNLWQKKQIYKTKQSYWPLHVSFHFPSTVTWQHSIRQKPKECDHVNTTNEK